MCTRFEDKGISLKLFALSTENCIGNVVNSGHMLGLDLEREELRVRAVSY